MPPVAEGLGGTALIGDVAEAKSPKPLEELNVLCDGGGAAAGFVAFGRASKKLPPPLMLGAAAAER